MPNSLTSLCNEKDSYAPFFIYRPNALKKAVRFFKQHFKANILYAVKANPHPLILKTLYQEGVTQFDVASIEEIDYLRSLLPEAQLYFMHPIKPRHAIHQAYFNHHIKHFSLDSEDELDKILAETKGAKDLHLHLRLSIPNAYAEMNMSGKFGITLQKAPDLLKRLSTVAAKVGICFHVGSQCMHPAAYRIATDMANEAIKSSGIAIDYFNVGGGFPSIYPGMIPPPLKDYFSTIHHEFETLKGADSITLLSEPGRALVAESLSLIVRVDLRKEDKLYINNGTYGNLFDAGHPNFIYPVQLIRKPDVATTTSDLLPFSFYGPTCDALDSMKGPFYLPNDTREGDYIEIGQMGAYGITMATRFNGFQTAESLVEFPGEPLMTLYNGDCEAQTKFEVIAA